MSKKKRGRPTLYTDELAEKIVSILRTGVNLRVAAKIVGLKPDVVYKWKKSHPDFFQKCEAARYEKYVRANSVELEMIAANNPHAVKTYLDREERKRHNRALERIRRQEQREKAGVEIIPSTLNMDEVIEGLFPRSEGE